MYDDQSMHPYMREMCIEWLEEYGSSFRVTSDSGSETRQDTPTLMDFVHPDVDEDSPSFRNAMVDQKRKLRWQAYLNTMKKDGEWGDHVCLLAIAEMLKVRLNWFGT